MSVIKVKEFAEQFPHYGETVSSFPKLVQYLVVSPSTPDDAREEILGRAEDGEVMSPTKAQSIVDRYKPPPEEAIEPEVVITGRTVADLLVILKANAMQIEELVEMGFTPGVIDQAIHSAPDRHNDQAQMEVAEYAETRPHRADVFGQLHKSAQYLLVKAFTPEGARDELP